MRASTATTKPKAAAIALSMAPSVSGTISCRAPAAKPPCGRWKSSSGRPKGRGLWMASKPGSRRRNSSSTKTRFRARFRAIPGERKRVAESVIEPVRLPARFPLRRFRGWSSGRGGKGCYVHFMFELSTVEQKENNASGYRLRSNSNGPQSAVPACSSAGHFALLFGLGPLALGP